VDPPSATGARSAKARAEVPPPPPRDQATSTFTRILDRLLAATPGAVGAVLVDYEGETVDYSGRVDPFELKVAAAHWPIVLHEVAEAKRVGKIAQIVVRARRRSYFVRRLEEDYAVVIILHRCAAFAVSDRAMQEAVAGLSVEAGWTVPRTQARWFSVDVETDRRDRARRPRRLKVQGTWQPVEVIGAMVGLAPREKGYRVRLQSGAEMMLVRERLGRWYADEHVERA
jgi:hypothetical protein